MAVVVAHGVQIKIAECRRVVLLHYNKDTEEIEFRCVILTNVMMGSTLSGCLLACLLRMANGW